MRERGGGGGEGEREREREKGLQGKGYTDAHSIHQFLARHLAFEAKTPNQSIVAAAPSPIRNHQGASRLIYSHVFTALVPIMDCVR